MLNFISENHASSEAREFVESKLRNQELDVLFIEFPNEVVRSMPLKQMLSQSVGESRNTIERNLSEYFGNLNRDDAEPNLKALTIEALVSGISVVPVDMSVDEVNDAFARLGRSTHHLSTVEWDPEAANPQPYEYEKLALRNEHMAQVISDTLPNPKGVQALFLCGANHFQPSVTRREVERSGWPADLNPLGVDEIFAEMQPDATQITTFIPRLPEREKEKILVETRKLSPFVIQDPEDMRRLEYIRQNLVKSGIESQSKYPVNPPPPPSSRRNSLRR